MRYGHRRHLPLHRLARMEQPSRRRPRDHPRADAPPYWLDWVTAIALIVAVIAVLWFLGLVRPV